MESYRTDVKYRSCQRGTGEEVALFQHIGLETLPRLRPEVLKTEPLLFRRGKVRKEVERERLDLSNLAGQPVRTDGFAGDLYPDLSYWLCSLIKARWRERFGGWLSAAGEYGFP